MKAKAVFSLVLLLFSSVLFAQEKNKFNIPLIGSAAPAFKAEATTGTLNFPGDFGNSWKILFSHPQDFTPVCTTEIMELAKLQNKLESLGVKVAVISTDTKERHIMWIKSIEEMLSVQGQTVKIKFPMIADNGAEVSRLYGMLHEPVSTKKDVRGVFIISPDNIVQSIIFYPVTVGRNMDEIVRNVEALQTVQASSLLTPANWQPGGDLLVPHFPYTKEEQAKQPGIEKDYYQVGSYLWFKKSQKP